MREREVIDGLVSIIMAWVIYAGIVFLISSLITVIVNFVLDRKGTKGAIRMLVRR